MLAITPAGAVTVRAPSSEIAPEGTYVSEPRTRFQGRVLRVYGPVSRPYLSVRPRRPLTAEQGLDLLGRSLLRDTTGRSDR